MINIVVNGKNDKFEKKLSISAFLQKKEIKKESVVVVLNENVIKKEDFEKIVIKDGDRVEILRFVSGG